MITGVKVGTTSSGVNQQAGYATPDNVEDERASLKELREAAAMRSQPCEFSLSLQNKISNYHLISPFFTRHSVFDRDDDSNDDAESEDNGNIQLVEDLNLQFKQVLYRYYYKLRQATLEFHILLFCAFFFFLLWILI